MHDWFLPVVSWDGGGGGIVALKMAEMTFWGKIFLCNPPSKYANDEGAPEQRMVHDIHWTVDSFAWYS